MLSHENLQVHEFIHSFNSRKPNDWEIIYLFYPIAKRKRDAKHNSLTNMFTFGKDITQPEQNLTQSTWLEISLIVSCISIVSMLLRQICFALGLLMVECVYVSLHWALSLCCLGGGVAMVTVPWLKMWLLLSLWCTGWTAPGGSRRNPKEILC